MIKRSENKTLSTSNDLNKEWDMQFIKPDVNINFIGIRKKAFILSLALVLASVISLVIHKGPRYGVDFEGGASIQVKFENSVKLGDIEKGINQLGIKGASVQRFGVPTDNEFPDPISHIGHEGRFFRGSQENPQRIRFGVPVVDVSVDMVGPQASRTCVKRRCSPSFSAPAEDLASPAVSS